MRLYFELFVSDMTQKASVVRQIGYRCYLINLWINSELKYKFSAQQQNLIVV